VLGTISVDIRPKFAIVGALFALVAGSLVVGAGPAGAAVRDVQTFACPPGLTTDFTDVAGTTHEASIACAVHYDLTAGTTPTTYGPSVVVTRGQMATFLMRLLFGAAPEPGDFDPSGFTDTAGSPHEGSIDGLVALEIASGTSATTFSPDEPVSRAQMATFLHRALELADPATLEGVGGAETFGDLEGNPHRDAIEDLAAIGIVAGTAPGTYDPSGSVSRGAMASFLVRTIDTGIESGAFTPETTSISFAAMEGADADGHGTAVIVTTDVPGVLCVAYEVTGIDGPATAALVEGDPNTGEAVVDLPAPEIDGATVRCISDPEADAVNADPGAYAVRVTNAAFPDGAIAGALGEPVSEFGGPLNDVEVVPGPGDENAFGSVDGFVTTEPGIVCFSTIVLSESPVTAAHLHEGAPHTNGPVVLDLDPITIDDLAAPSNSILGTECSQSSAAAELASDPDPFYVDVHSEAFPAGALRAQLRQVDLLSPDRAWAAAVGNDGR
jgi:hypothetical protein